MRPVKLKSSIIAITLLVLVACGSSDMEMSVPDNQVIKPAEGDKSWETTDVIGVEISVPADWEKSGPTSPGLDAEQFMFQTTKNSFGTRGGVQLTTLPTLKDSAKNLVRTIEAQVVATVGATQFTSEQIVWPGAKDAWYITYVTHLQNDDKFAPHPAEVLVVDLAGGGQSQVTVTALDEDFEPQRMHEILQTLTITKGAGGSES